MGTPGSKWHRISEHDHETRTGFCSGCQARVKYRQRYHKGNNYPNFYCSVLHQEQDRMRKNRRSSRKVRTTNQRHNHKKTYKLTREQFEQMVAKAKGCCAICGEKERPELGPTYKLHVDHCHASGKVRDLLCRTCNFGLGNFKDKPELLLAAVEYLRKHQTPTKRVKLRLAK